MKPFYWLAAIPLATTMLASVPWALQDCSDVDSSRGKLYSKSLGNEDVGASFYAGATTLHYRKRCSPLSFIPSYTVPAQSNSYTRMYGEAELADVELDIGFRARAYKSSSEREASIEICYLKDLVVFRIPWTDRYESSRSVTWNRSFPVSVLSWKKTVWAGPIPFTVGLDIDVDFEGELGAGVSVVPGREDRAYTTAQASGHLSVNGHGGVGISAANVSVIFDGVLLNTALSSSLGVTFPSGVHEGPGGTLEIRPWELRLKVCGEVNVPFFGRKRYCAVDKSLTGSSTTLSYQL